jgi:hypothetical protein
VDDVVERAPDRSAHARVVVADRGADLPGGEVEHPPAARGLDERAGRAHDQLVGERAAVSDQAVGVHGAGV